MSRPPPRRLAADCGWPALAANAIVNLRDPVTVLQPGDAVTVELSNGKTVTATVTLDEARRPVLQIVNTKAGYPSYRISRIAAGQYRLTASTR